MSHIAVVKLEIRDLDALRSACAQLGLEWREGQKTFRWFGQFMGDSAPPEGLSVQDYGKCDHAIAVRGSETAYEVGVVRKTDGTYSLAFDSWDGGKGLEQIVGRGCRNLVREYTTAIAKRTLALRGYLFGGTKKLADGTTELVFTKS